MKVEQDGHLSLYAYDLIDPDDAPNPLTFRHFRQEARQAVWYARQVEGCLVRFVAPGRREEINTTIWHGH